MYEGKARIALDAWGQISNLSPDFTVPDLETRLKIIFKYKGILLPNIFQILLSNLPHVPGAEGDNTIRRFRDRA
jgi:hypothetical protein